MRTALSLTFVHALAVISLPVAAQLTVVQGSAMNMTPEQLVQNYLVGPGITISNVTFNGSSSLITSDQIGTFETQGIASVQLGLDGGILMTSGKAELAIGPNNKANAGHNTGGGGDPDLNIISNSTTFDKAVLEFDFIPEFDTVRFRYVFGSEEFFEYCSGYNDAFGFFLSGPGINGTFSNNAINIALMPGGSTSYVTINNICNDLLSRWDNNGGAYFQYDALTYVFTAVAAVQPCSTYHIKLAVADAVDHIYDSGVFLEENSFSSIGVNLQLSTPNPSIGVKAVEGCNDVILSFKLTAPPEQPYTIQYLISGTAINGTDYTWIPSSLTFPANIDSLALVIHPIQDMIPEGEETLIITVDQITCDGSVTADTILLYDYSPMQLIPEQDTTLCHGQDVKLFAGVSDGYPPYSYLWSPVPCSDSVLQIIPPPGNNTFIAQITDLCGNTLFDTVEVLVHPTPSAFAGNDTTIANGTSIILRGQSYGGYGDYFWQWNSIPPGFNSNQQNTPTGNLTMSTIFSLQVTDTQSLCPSEPDLVVVAVEGGPLSVNPVAIPSSICLGDQTELFSLAGGGSGWYTFQWSSDPPGFNSTEQNPVVSPDVTTSYNLVLDDGFNQVSGSATVNVHPLPVIYLGPPDTTVCIYDTLRLDAGNPGAVYEWSDGRTTRTITAVSSGIGFEIQSYMVRVTNANGCTDSSTIHVYFTFDACTGFTDMEGAYNFRIYPNPSEGCFTLRSDPVKDPVDITITGITGIRIMAETIFSAGSPIFHKIDLSGFPPGIYFVYLKNPSLNRTLKVIIL